MIEGFEVGEEGALLEFLEIASRRQEGEVGTVEWCDGEGVPEKELFIGQNGQG